MRRKERKNQIKNKIKRVEIASDYTRLEERRWEKSKGKLRPERRKKEKRRYKIWGEITLYEHRREAGKNGWEKGRQNEISKQFSNSLV